MFRRFIGKKKKASFKRILYFYTLILSIVPVLLLGIVSSSIAMNAVQEEVNHNHQVVLNQVQYQADRFLQMIDTDSIQLANNTMMEKLMQVGPSMKNFDLFIEMLDLIQNQRGISEISYDVSLVFSKYGKIHSNRYGYINDDEFPYSDLINRFRTPGKFPFIISPYTYPNQSEILIARPVPLFYADEPDGYIIFHVATSPLMSLIQESELGNKRRVLILDDQAKVVMSPNPEEIGKRLYSSQLYQYWSNPSLTARSLTLDNIEYQFSSQKSVMNNWSYISLTETSLLTAKSQWIVNLTWLMVLVLTILWAIVVYFGTKRLHIPIESLISKIPLTVKTVPNEKDSLKALDIFIEYMVSTNDQLQSQINEQIPYLKEIMLQKLLRGEIDSDYAKKMDSYRFFEKSNFFYVCVVELDKYALFRETYEEKDRALLWYALRKMIIETYEEEPRFFSVTSMPLSNQIAIIIGMEKVNDKSEETLRHLTHYFIDKINQYFPFTVTAALSKPVRDYRSICEGYQQARDLLSYRLLLGSNQLIVPEDIQSSVEKSRASIFRTQKSIVHSILHGNLETAKNKLYEMEQMVPQVMHNVEAVRGLFTYLIGEIEVHMQEMGLDESSILPKDRYTDLYSMTSLNEVTEWFIHVIFPRVIEHIHSTQVSLQKKLVQQILFYIHEHYDTDLSLQQIADEFETSPSHISRVFKEETLVNFSDYLIQYRMDKAKEFLIHTDMPIKDISEKLCYTSVQNFNRIFKQTVHMPPGKYRKQFREAPSDQESESSVEC
ncbi:AraC family transcriptional regulator [Paenibacillus sp. N3/727]|uniref:AraC family transcriptional regulator n=1 Tax=Paenibacillus sp. N3/727 TaxID=2925845 RepID=UPI001F53C017|nr:AraC family transcriptional regulator [Paenibacillus sp. N3/727]UNK18847.1 AraC family transcriptional regulator [Paenibacillus sp. N3/727]